jgi:hypothetical protein
MPLWTEEWLQDYISDDRAPEPKKPRRKPIFREHIRQRHVKLWVRDCVAPPGPRILSPAAENARAGASYIIPFWGAGHWRKVVADWTEECRDDA